MVTFRCIHIFVDIWADCHLFHYRVSDEDKQTKLLN